MLIVYSYGEQGLAVITQVLFDLFPTLPADKIYPLDLNTYRSLVLVPETALLLIQEDLRMKHGPNKDITRSLALKVLRKSHKYGLAMFPVGDGESFVAGDALARNRAKKNKLSAELPAQLDDENKADKPVRSIANIHVDLTTSDEASDIENIITVGTRPKSHQSSRIIPTTKLVTADRHESADRLELMSLLFNL